MSDQKQEEQDETCLSPKIADVMVREVITLSDNVTVKEAAEIMNKSEIGSLIITDRGKAVGIVRKRPSEEGCGRRHECCRHKGQGDHD